MISNLSSSHLRSKQGEAQAPEWSRRTPTPGSQQARPQLGSAASPSIKEQPVVTAATIYLIKMGYSGAILRYVNECYIIHIY